MNVGTWAAGDVVVAGGLCSVKIRGWDDGQQRTEFLFCDYSPVGEAQSTPEAMTPNEQKMVDQLVSLSVLITHHYLSSLRCTPHCLL